MTESNLSVDDILDGTLDDLDDLPEFKAFAPGVHQVFTTMSIKDIGDNKAVEFAFKMISTIELANPKGIEPKEGDTSSTICMLNNEFGLGALKKLAAPIREALGLEKTSEVIEQCIDIECIIVTGLRVDKKDKDKIYLQVKELQVIGA